MSYEDGGEKGQSVKPKQNMQSMTLQKAVDMGEYDPNYLSTFPEWVSFSPHVQLQYIKQGLDNRRKQLLMQWAEIDRTSHHSIKTDLHEAQNNIEKQLKKIEIDRERLYAEYASKF